MRRVLFQVIGSEKPQKKIKKNKITDLIILEYKNTKYKIDFDAKKNIFFFKLLYSKIIYLFFFSIKIKLPKLL